MKRIFILLFAVISLMACETEPLDPSLNTNNNNSNSGGGSSNVSIEGSWMYDVYELDVTATTVIMGNPVSLSSTTTLVDSNATLTFLSNGEYNIVGDMTIESMSAGIPPTSQTIDATSNGTYTFDGTTLNVFPDLQSNPALSPFPEGSYTVSSLTATALEMTVDDTIMQNTGGVDTTIDLVGFVTFTR